MAKGNAQAEFIGRIVKQFQRDKHQILPHIAPDCVYTVGTWRRKSLIPIFGRYKGPEGVRQFFDTWDKHLVTVRCGLVPAAHYFTRGNHVSLTGHNTFQLVGGKETVDSYWCLFWQVKGEQILSLRWVFDEDPLAHAFSQRRPKQAAQRAR